MSHQIWEAMLFTKNIALKNRETVVQYWLNDTKDDYVFKIWYESSQEVWLADITEGQEGKSIADICSDKYHIAVLVFEGKEDNFIHETI